MKKIGIIILANVLSFTSFTQKTEGIITYVENIDMTPALEKANAQMDSASKQYPERVGMMDGMKKKIEEMLKSMEKMNTMLTFKGNESLYKEKPAELTEGEILQEENFMMKMKPQPDVIYYSKENNQHLIQKNFMGKDFLVKDTIQNYKWKLIMERKMIKGYACMKATKEDSLYKIEAWFTSQIPVSSGPKGLYGLPGMILEAKLIKKEIEGVEENSSMGMMNQFAMDMIIKVDKIEFKEVSKKALKKPNKGKVVGSEKEYNELVIKKVIEMQKFRGGGKGRRGGGFKMRH
jgi:GLPGLI family protein